MIIDRKKTLIVTDEGEQIIHRVTVVLCPNGKYRYPTDYYDATAGVVKVSQREKDFLKVPGYKQFI